VSSSDGLLFDAESMRRLGYEVVDRLVEWSAHLDAGPVSNRATRADLTALVEGAPGEGPSDFTVLLDRLLVDVIPFGQRTDHPRFMGYVPGNATWPSVLGDLLVDGCNVFGGSWIGNAGTTVVELTVLDWFKEWLGLPADSEGLLTSGGSEANLLAVLCARHARLDDRIERAVVYVSNQSHASVDRALHAAGFATEQIRAIPLDASFRMRADALAAAIDEDRSRGFRPCLVIANAGATNTGAIDPLPEIAACCAENDLWFHVDAAYGGFFALTERGSTVLSGIGAANSVTLDPHKGLAQPWGTGCLLVREPGALADTFHMLPSYLRDVARFADAVNLFDRGLQLTRPARAVKIWLSVHTVGLAAFRASLDASIDHARHAEVLIAAHPNGRVVTPANLGIVTFRRRDGADQRAVELLNDSGRAHVSTTTLDGLVTLRLCINNFRTTTADVEMVVDGLLGAPE
jgi:glutamate/tyrosine decarboxylase-like PLP-dependent enzyme